MYLYYRNQPLVSMKNEDRIVELLPESLKRQDQLVEGFQGMQESIQGLERWMERVEAGILSVVSSVDGLTDLVKVALDRTKQIDELAE